MAKTKYDVGDILTWCEDGNCYATAVIVKWHTKDMYVEGISLKRYTNYDLFIKSEEKDNFELVHDAPEVVFLNYKIVGHIDISGMSIKEIETELVYAIAYEWHENKIADAVQKHWALIKPHEPKEESKYVRMGFCIPETNVLFCCYNLADKLKEECKQKQKHLDLANYKIFELKKEIDSLRNSCRNDKIRIATNLRKIGFTSETICNIIETDMV